MNESTSSKRPRNLPSIILFLALTVVLLIAAVFLWRSHTESKDQLQALSVQNSRLQEELEAARKEIDHLSSGDPSPKTKEQLSDSRQNRTSSFEEAETLVLQPPTVRQTDEGLVVHFEYEPVEDAELPDEITLVVRVPNSSTSKILKLEPVSAADDSNVRAVVHPAGYLGLIQGTPSDLGSMAFEFTVPDSVKATVRGSQGILDYEFDITPDGCTVRKL